MNTEPEASPRTPTGETPLSTTPEIRYWQHVASGAITSDTSWAVTYHDRYREVTVTPVNGSRPDSDVIERAARLLHALQWMGDQEDADAAWDRYPITSATRSDYLRTAETLAAAGLLTPSDTFVSTKSSDAELDPMPFIWPGGVRSMFSHGDSERLIFAPRPEFSQVPGDYAPFRAITVKGSLFDREVEKRVADVAERIAQAWDEGYQAHEDEYWCGDGENPYRATPPEIPGFEGTRSALDGLTIRKEQPSD